MCSYKTSVQPKLIAACLFLALVHQGTLSAIPKSQDDCLYQYITQPPSNLTRTCDPFPLNSLSLECSILVQDPIPGNLTVEWLFSAGWPAMDTIVINVTTTEVSQGTVATANVTVPETKVGYYFCHPVSSNTGPLKNSTPTLIASRAIYFNLQSCQDLQLSSEQSECAQLVTEIPEEPLPIDTEEATTVSTQPSTTTTEQPGASTRPSPDGPGYTLMGPTIVYACIAVVGGVTLVVVVTVLVIAYCYKKGHKNTVPKSIGRGSRVLRDHMAVGNTRRNGPKSVPSKPIPRLTPARVSNKPVTRSAPPHNLVPPSTPPPVLKVQVAKTKSMPNISTYRTCNRQENKVHTVGRTDEAIESCSYIDANAVVISDSTPPTKENRKSWIPSYSAYRHDWITSGKRHLTEQTLKMSNPRLQSSVTHSSRRSSYSADSDTEEHTAMYENYTKGSMYYNVHPMTRVQIVIENERSDTEPSGASSRYEQSIENGSKKLPGQTSLPEHNSTMQAREPRPNFSIGDDLAVYSVTSTVRVTPVYQGLLTETKNYCSLYHMVSKDGSIEV